jgi:hypothetical protein
MRCAARVKNLSKKKKKRTVGYGYGYGYGNTELEHAWDRLF